MKFGIFCEHQLNTRAHTVYLHENEDIVRLERRMAATEAAGAGPVAESR